MAAFLRYYFNLRRRHHLFAADRSVRLGDYADNFMTALQQALQSRHPDVPGSKIDDPHLPAIAPPRAPRKRHATLPQRGIRARAEEGEQKDNYTSRHHRIK